METDKNKIIWFDNGFYIPSKVEEDEDIEFLEWYIDMRKLQEYLDEEPESK